MKTRLIPWLCATTLLLGSGCGGSDTANPSSGGVRITPADRQAALEKFNTLCATCHGPQGAGDGPGSAGLVPQPRNFQDPVWQASVTDEHIEKIIVGGGPSVGKAVAMPPNPELRSKPGVVAALREHVRSLGKSKADKD